MKPANKDKELVDRFVRARRLHASIIAQMRGCKMDLRMFTHNPKAVAARFRELARRGRRLERYMRKNHDAFEEAVAK